MRRRSPTASSCPLAPRLFWSNACIPPSTPPSCSPDVAQKFADLGADPQFGTPAEFAAYVAADLAKWTRLANEAGLKAE